MGIKEKYTENTVVYIRMYIIFIYLQIYILIGFCINLGLHVREAGPRSVVRKCHV